jgi:large subunit ribosomal protein L18
MLTPDRLRRQKRIRAKVAGTSSRPRLSVYRSNKYMYAQLIDDTVGKTLVSAKGQKASEVGKKIAELATKLKVKAVVFDRGGYRYHGRVPSLAESAREGGLVF